MRIAFLVNRAGDVVPRRTTSLLMHSAVMRGHDVWLLGMNDLIMTSDTAIYADARPVVASPTSPAQIVAQHANDARRQPIESFDLLFLRTNPGRDQNRIRAHECVLAMARRAAQRGVVVLNHPDGLLRSATKMCLFDLPAHVRPATFIARNIAAVEELVRSLEGPAVVKPVRGSRGEDVFMIAKGDRSNHRQIIEVIRRDSYVMVQEYVPGAEGGDQRVHVVDGAVLEVNGRASVVGRVPSGGDFRSNVHVGGAPRPGLLTDGMRAAVAAISDWLRQEGLFFVGLDFIGDRIIEVNAFMPGGLWEGSGYQERDFADAVITAAEDRVHERSASFARTQARSA